MDSRIEKQFNRTGTWIRKFIRGTEKERPAQLRVADEIMKLLVKRETSLSDALDALTMVMLNSLGRMYGPREEFSRFFERVSTFLAPTERDRAVGLIPLPGAAKVQPRTVTMVGERSERTHRLAVEVGEVMAKCAPKSSGDGFNALNSTMLTAIEAACGRERADEFDLLVGEFSRKMQSLPVGVGVKGGAADFVWMVNEENIARVEQNLARLHPGEQLVVVYQDVPPEWTTYSVTMTPQNEEATLKSLSADTLKLAEREPTHRAVIVFRSQTDEPAIWSYLKKLVADAAGH